MSGFNIKESAIQNDYLLNNIIRLSRIGSVPISVSTNVTSAVPNSIYLVNSTSNAVSITLPVSPLDGTCVTVIDDDGTAQINNITLLPGVGNTIKGVNVISTAFHSIKAIFKGTSWNLI
jgi:hypothetical protein